MAQAVVPKREEKMQRVFNSMEDKHDVEEFKSLFKSMYPRDWNRILQRYDEHQRRVPPGKYHPMPAPEKYLSNMFKVCSKKFQ